MRTNRVAQTCAQIGSPLPGFRKGTIPEPKRPAATMQSRFFLRVSQVGTARGLSGSYHQSVYSAVCAWARLGAFSNASQWFSPRPNVREAAWKISSPARSGSLTRGIGQTRLVHQTRDCLPPFAGVSQRHHTGTKAHRGDTATSLFPARPPL